MNPFENNSRLSADEASQLARQVAALSQSGLPLAAGLRAVAADAPSRRLASALATLADQLERGQSLDDALATLGPHLPNAIRGLISAASRSGRLGPMLGDMLEQQRRQRTTWRAISAALRYPLAMFALSLIVAFALPMLIAAELRPLLEESSMKLPYGTRATLWLGDVAGPWLLISVVAAAALLGIARIVASEAAWRSVWSLVPLVGPMWRWCGLAEMSRLLAALLDAGLPLPDALVATGGGVADENAAGTAHKLALGVRQGRSLSDLLQVAPGVPRMVVPVVEWGERSSALPEALRTVAELLEARVRARAVWLRMTLPPVVFLLIGVTVLGPFSSLLMPLVEMISKITGG